MKKITKSSRAPSDEVAAAVVERFPGTVFPDSHGQPVVYVDRAVWLDVATFLRDEQQFTQCLDVTAVDHLVASPRPGRPASPPSASRWWPTSSPTRATVASA